LYINGVIYSTSEPTADAILVTDGVIEWVGDARSALLPADTTTVDLNGAFLAPGFVDSHAHVIGVGQTEIEVDLRQARSAEDVLDRVSERAAELPAGGIVRGFGWDETLWATPALPSFEQLERAAGERPVYLARVDSHSALVTRASFDHASMSRPVLLSTDPGLVKGPERTEMAAVFNSLTESESQEAAERGLAAFARTGHVAVVENAAPHLGGIRDLVSLKAASLDSPFPEVYAYWGELAETAEGAEAAVRALEDALGRPDVPRWVLGLAGDLNIDGSIGSRTAALREPYTDAEINAESGLAYLTPEQVRDHFVATTQARLQGGFHVIGDRGMDIALQGAEMAIEIVGDRAFASRGHRLEHAEMTDDDALARMLKAFLTASSQPGFDAAWGHAGGLYEQRLGERRLSMNRFATMSRLGIPLAFGSDAPVLEASPWAQIKAAINHSNPDEAITARGAFNAHTRGAWRALNRNSSGGPKHGEGQIVPGAPASFAIWEIDELAIQIPDPTVSAWSTDSRSRVPMLPALDTENMPRVLRTVAQGVTIFDSGDLT
jgi:predicted amidohydrolase YtcJ